MRSGILMGAEFRGGDVAGLVGRGRILLGLEGWGLEGWGLRRGLSVVVRWACMKHIKEF